MTDENNKHQAETGDIATPLVSVVMSVFNVEQYLAKNGIESILNQTMTDFEFIIVDDGSTDSSPAIIRNYQQRDKRIKAIFLEENVGIARARNVGLAIARGKYMAVQDADDISYPNRLERQLATMEHNPSLAMVGAAMKVRNNLSGQESIARYATTVEAVRAAAANGSMASTHLVFFARLAAVRRAGGYHPALIVAEDMDLFFRLLEQGDIINLPDVLVENIQHGRNSSDRIPLFKATCAIAASKSALARARGQPDILAGRETPPGLEVLATAQNGEERLMMIRFIMSSLLWGFDREGVRVIYQQLLDEGLAMLADDRGKVFFYKSSIDDLMNQKRMFFAEHYVLLRQLLIAMLAQVQGGVNNLSAIKDVVRKFLTDKQQDAAWVDDL